MWNFYTPWPGLYKGHGIFFDGMQMTTSNDMSTFNLLVMITFASISTTLEVSSPSFKNGGYIPVTYTCEGKNINPAIEIKNIPLGTKSLALIMDAPDAPGGTFDHWLIWNLDPGKGIKENSSPGQEGKNGMGKKGYTGPCPPAGTGVHHYHFKVYALNAKLDLGAMVSKMELETAIKSHVLARGELIGLYGKTK